MTFYVGQIRPFHPSEVKHISSEEDLKSVVQGDIIETLGHLTQWDEDCVPVKLCESWRQIGDPVCDAALREVFPQPSATVGKDLLQALKDHVASNTGKYPAAEAFLDQVLQTPPAGLSATEEEVIIAQELFIDDSVQIMQALLHYSLAGGLARSVCLMIPSSLDSPRIVRTLDAVSYLLPHVKKTRNELIVSLEDIEATISAEARDRTFVRLVETMQFVLEVMGCSASPAPPDPPTPTLDGAKAPDDIRRAHNSKLADLLPEGEGWRSAVRVRLLHGVARWRVQARWERDGHADTTESVPISQEETAATLAAFSTIPIWCLRRLHLPPSAAKARAYLALWRHVGFYMGVAPSILLRYFTTLNAADKFIATAALNLFLEGSPASQASARSPSDPAPLLKGPTLPILVAVSRRPPLNTSLVYNVALTTHLLGRPLARHLGLPPSGWWMLAKMHAFLLVQRVPHYFARWYPRAGWLEKRRAVLREGMVRTVRWNLGMRRTAFRPRTGIDEVGAGNGETRGGPGDSEREGGQLAPGVAEEEGVRPDPARARLLTRQWKEVLYEMVGVSVAVCVVGGVFGYLGMRYVMSSVLYR
ncbi:hypothetical protein C8Q80DRAFT_1220314 [Daedaleopsis nitida]|nr:hypothetical protein C8Q80DRAFT_1220314 [Daedaleopsis nitida]